MAERAGRRQCGGGTEHCRNTLEPYVHCESGKVLRMAVVTHYRLALERTQEQ